ncbi:DUF2393 family protein [Helicobacter cetorum]|uniref:DUF2393 family protein n=1 Tax=Helicobacter cetorum TaxID=138563 RepID=UPI000CF089FC|nr:DUF2393 family protein [Helicobacter cetorum]
MLNNAHIQAVQAFLETFKDFLSNATLVSALIFGVLALFCALLLLVTLLSRNRVISIVSVLLFFGAFLSMPFMLKQILTKYLYPIETQLVQANPLSYTNAFSLQVEVKNTGKFVLQKCFLRLEILKTPHNFVEEYAFKWFVKKTYEKTFEEKIFPKESKSFSLFIDDYPYAKTSPYQVSLSCL